MSQKFTLYDDLTVAENLSFTASLRKIERQTFLARRTELLDFIGFERPLDTSVRDLPGGLKQQISLAAALLHDPAIIFLDEPTAGVTPAARARFWSLIGNLKKAGKTIFVTTHYMDEAENCDRIALMRAGELIALDSAAGLKATAFPEPIWELTPMASPVTRVDIEALRRAEAVRSLQPYGIRFHLILKPGQQLEQLAPLLHGRFQVARTLPSLEDVFIELVEGGRHP
jgi:ABC-2 type transport system ATP-binding protein